MPRLTSDEVARALGPLAGTLAAGYAKERLLPAANASIGAEFTNLHELREGLSNAESSFRLLIGYYAALRRGGDPEFLSEAFLEAFDRTLEDSEFEDFLDSGDTEALWLSFCEVCGERQRRVDEAQTRPVLTGLAALAMETFAARGHGNLHAWIEDTVRATRQVEPIFERFKETKTVGPKTASHILRDAAIVFGFEVSVAPADRLYLHPVGVTLRRLALWLLPDSEERKLPDWVLAGKFSKVCRLHRVSGVHANAGATYFGFRIAPLYPTFEEAVREVLLRDSQPVRGNH